MHVIKLVDYTFPTSTEVNKEEPLRLVAHNVGESALLSYAGIVNLSGNPGDIIVTWKEFPPQTVRPGERTQRTEMFYVCKPWEFLGTVKFMAAGHYRIRLDAGIIYFGEPSPTDYVDLDVYVSEAPPSGAPPSGAPPSETPPSETPPPGKWWERLEWYHWLILASLAVAVPVTAYFLRKS